MFRMKRESPPAAEPVEKQKNAVVHTNSLTRMERFNDSEFWDAVDLLAGCPLPSETPRAYDADVESLIRWARVVRRTTTHAP